MQTTYAQKNETAQRAADNTAAAVLDNSPQSESLQRKADLTNGVVQREFDGPLTSNADVEQQDSDVFDEQKARFTEAVSLSYDVVYKNGDHRRIFLRIGTDVPDWGDYSKMAQLWVNQLMEMSILVPDGLEVYVSNVFTYQQSFNFGSGKISIKPQSIANLLHAGPTLGLNQYNLVANQLSNGDPVKFGATTMMHELGHILHEKSSPTFFRQKTTAAATDKKSFETAPLVSDYAGTKTQAEFVAETFAGLANGLLYDENVVTLYWELCGPCCGEIYEARPGKYGFRK
ncbi:hypothetical protein [Fibrobacter sp. HC4]|uniref:hypothetical protein n=1 Tax=Fibrobacter sp. HC4 TaxID=3239812 RepID=UPI00201A1D6F|nr:hypothetical protein [Fibrobacter succinogenes]MCL4100895.1 hypothetical protein [Fibrobacter succinogenes]